MQPTVIFNEGEPLPRQMISTKPMGDCAGTAMTTEGKHFRPKEGQRNSRILSMMDKYRQKVMRLPLALLLESYQTSFGLHTTVIHEDILRRRTDGTLYKERGTPKKVEQVPTTPAKTKAFAVLIDFCETHKFVRADNAFGGGITIRKVASNISTEAVLLRLREDAATLPEGVTVFYRVEDDKDTYGVVLHYDYEDFVVTFK